MADLLLKRGHRSRRIPVYHSYSTPRVPISWLPLLVLTYRLRHWSFPQSQGDGAVSMSPFSFRVLGCERPKRTPPIRSLLGVRRRGPNPDSLTCTRVVERRPTPSAVFSPASSLQRRLHPHGEEPADGEVQVAEGVAAFVGVIPQRQFCQRSASQDPPLGSGWRLAQGERTGPIRTLGRLLSIELAYSTAEILTWSPSKMMPMFSILGKLVA